MLGRATLTIVPSRKATPEPSTAAHSARRAVGLPHRSAATASAVAVEQGDEPLRRDRCGRRRRRCCASSSQSGPTSRRTPSQPRPPTYGGRKNRSGSVSTSSACAPGGAAHQMPTLSSPWWSLTNVTKHGPFSRTKKLGLPCESRSVASGSARQAARTWSSTTSGGEAGRTTARHRRILPELECQRRGKPRRSHSRTEKRAEAGAEAVFVGVEGDPPRAESVVDGLGRLPEVGDRHAPRHRAAGVDRQRHASRPRSAPSDRPRPWRRGGRGTAPCPRAGGRSRRRTRRRHGAAPPASAPPVSSPAAAASRSSAVNRTERVASRPTSSGGSAHPAADDRRRRVRVVGDVRLGPREGVASSPDRTAHDREGAHTPGEHGVLGEGGGEGRQRAEGQDARALRAPPPSGPPAAAWRARARARARRSTTRRRHRRGRRRRGRAPPLPPAAPGPKAPRTRARS